MTTEPEKIYPPWSDEEVVVLRAWQNAHPVEAMLCTQNTHFSPPTLPMVATILGMCCQEEGCGYTQEWAYAYMLEDALGS
jgi:hypothetical protein